MSSVRAIKTALSKEVKNMQRVLSAKDRQRDRELVEVLSAISVVSGRLATKLALIQGKSTKGEKMYGKNERNSYADRRTSCGGCRY